MTWTVAVIIAVWAALAAFPPGSHHRMRQPEPDRAPGWAIRGALARRGPENIEYVRVLAAPVRVRMRRPTGGEWTAPIPAAPVQVLPLDPDTHWKPAHGGATLRLRAVHV